MTFDAGYMSCSSCGKKVDTGEAVAILSGAARAMGFSGIVYHLECVTPDTNLHAELDAAGVIG